jgi:hypothetical protein
MHSSSHCSTYEVFSACFPSPFLITDPNNVLCLRPYWLANVLQLTELKVEDKVYRQSFRPGAKPLEVTTTVFSTERLR